MAATATQAKGGWTIAIDASQSQAGASPASSMVVQIMDPTGAPVTFEVAGKTAKEITLSAPFQTTALVRKPVPGLYTVHAKATAANPKAPSCDCEGTTTIAPAGKKIEPFIEGNVGKERRVRNIAATGAPELLSGVCSPLFGVKGGVDIKLSDTWRLAPGVGVAFNTKDKSNSSLYAEVELNRWFGERKGFIGTGIGAWDITHSDTRAPTWLLQFGHELYEAKNTSGLYFVASGRLFLDKMNNISNNYQFFGGFRYIFR
jgi:hypothetical protein